jgi:hypothetical protein
VLALVIVLLAEILGVSSRLWLRPTSLQSIPLPNMLQ